MLKLLRAAERNIRDSHAGIISDENRFDAAYKAIMQCAMVALWANGFRTSTSVPGHHQTAIQALPKTLGLSGDRVVVLDALRKRRHIADYEGDPIPEGTLMACRDQAETLFAEVRDWLRVHHPELIDDSI